MSEKEEIIKEIYKLKKEKNAIILVHNYQILEVQKIADFIGDSLQLAREASKVQADIILFCGVRFMAETAKLLNPDAKVLLSAKEAGCPMADMINRNQLIEFKAKYPNSVVVCYVNSSVEVKAESDICCTSSNAIKIVNSIPADKTVLFVPDQNLGSYAAKKTKRNVVVWKGYCYTHHLKISIEDVKKIRQKYPDYSLLVHPECSPEVVAKADFVASTKGMVDFAKEHNNMIIGTELGLYEQLKDKYPNKNIVSLSAKAICNDMKKTTLKTILATLEKEYNEIIIEKEIAIKAVRSINNMLRLS